MEYRKNFGTEWVTNSPLSFIVSKKTGNNKTIMNFLQCLNLAAGYPHCAQVFFWLWNDLRPQRRQRVCDLL